MTGSPTHNIPIGAKREESLLVTSHLAINFLGLDEGRVLATPEMIRYMERTSRNLVSPFLEPGHETVGTHVNVYHRAAAPIGTVVKFTSEITAATERRVTFRVEARTHNELIGDGTHERAIISIAKFATRAASKQRSTT